MKLKTLLAWLSLVAPAVLPAVAQAQSAADWPNKSVRMIVNFGPGGSADNSIRPFIEGLNKAFGQQFVVEHRGGASGALGIEAVTKAAPDGYTYVVTPALSVVILPHLRKLAYDPLKDLAPVSQITDGTLLFAVHPSLPVNSVQEVVAWSKSNPGKLSWGTAGVGSYGHITAEVFKLVTGADILHVPYRGGGESLADFLAGVVQIHADPNTMAHIPAGKAKLLAVLDRERHPDYPNVPLLKEIYPEINFTAWFAVYGPAGTPKPIIDKFAAELNRIARDPAVAPIHRKVALAPNPGTPAELMDLTQKDFDRFQGLIKKIGIKAE